MRRRRTKKKKPLLPTTRFFTSPLPSRIFTHVMTPLFLSAPRVMLASTSCRAVAVSHDIWFFLKKKKKKKKKKKGTNESRRLEKKKTRGKMTTKPFFLLFAFASSIPTRLFRALWTRSPTCSRSTRQMSWLRLPQFGLRRAKRWVIGREKDEEDALGIEAFLNLFLFLSLSLRTSMPSLSLSLEFHTAAARPPRR